MVVRRGDLINQGRAPFMHQAIEFSRDITLDKAAVVLGRNEPSPFLAQANDALKIFARPDWHLERYHGGVEHRARMLNRPKEIGVIAVELIDEKNARHLLLHRHFPDHLGTDFHPRCGIEHNHGPINDAHRGDHIGGEIGEPRCIE